MAAENIYHVNEQCYYQQQDYKRAAGPFYDSMQKAGKSDLGQTAAYKLGWAYYRREEFWTTLARPLPSCVARISPAS